MKSILTSISTILFAILIFSIFANQVTPSEIENLDFKFYPKILDKTEQTFIVIGHDAPAEDVLSASNIVLELQKYLSAPIYVVLDNEVKEPFTNANVILIGSPEDNAFTEKVVTEISQNKGLLKTYQDRINKYIVISGSDSFHTRKASLALRYFEKFQPSGAEICTIGDEDDIDRITMVRCIEEELVSETDFSDIISRNRNNEDQELNEEEEEADFDESQDSSEDEGDAEDEEIRELEILRDELRKEIEALKQEHQYRKTQQQEQQEIKYPQYSNGIKKNSKSLLIVSVI